jgi:hypothetical protein
MCWLSDQLLRVRLLWVGARCKPHHHPRQLYSFVPNPCEPYCNRFRAPEILVPRPPPPPPQPPDEQIANDFSLSMLALTAWHRVSYLCMAVRQSKIT